MPVTEVDIALVKVGTASAGPFATVSELDDISNDRGTEGTTRRNVFGSAAAHVKAGRKTSSYAFSGLLDMADTAGQNVLEDAYNNGTDVYVQFLPNPTAATTEKTGWSEKCKVTGYTANGARDGDFMEVSFALEGDGVQTDIIAP